MKQLLFLVIILLSSCSTTKKISKSETQATIKADSSAISSEETIYVEWDIDSSNLEFSNIPFNPGCDSGNGKNKSNNNENAKPTPPKKGFIKIIKTKKTKITENTKISAVKEKAESKDKPNKKKSEPKVLKSKRWQTALICTIAIIICFLVKNRGKLQKIIENICPKRK
mgnify:CR=1 FL=1